MFRERQARWNAEERARGWHVHYDGFEPETTSFLRDPAGLLVMDEAFERRYLTERLAGVGIPREAPVTPRTTQESAS